MDATPSFDLPPDADPGLPEDPPSPMRFRGRTFTWGSRTYLMGIVNVTPDSFSGDGILAPAARDLGRGADTDEAFRAAVAQGVAMAAAGADMLDVGGESSRPGHEPVPEAEEVRRVLPVVRALREALPDMPISIDTVKPRVAEAALDAGADLINDVWGVGKSDAMARVAAERRVPYIVMHGRAEARYQNLMAEILTDLQRAIDRAVALGVAWQALIVDPGFGFGKTPAQNLYLMAHLADLRILGRPVLLGASRKSTIGKVLDLPAYERLEGTLATTALAVGAGVDLIRVHDVAANRRAARMADAIHRPGTVGPEGWQPA